MLQISDDIAIDDQELVERFNTRSQAKFYIEHAGSDFNDYEREDDAYRSSLEVLRRSLDFEMPAERFPRGTAAEAVGPQR